MCVREAPRALYPERPIDEEGDSPRPGSRRRCRARRVAAIALAAASMPWFAAPASAVGVTSLVSREGGAATTGANGVSWGHALTPDGRFVLFESTAANVVAGVSDPNSGYDVFVLDRQTGVTELVSRTASSATTAGNALSHPVAITPDGRYVLFVSQATDLVAGFADQNGLGSDVFVFDRQTGMAELVSGSDASPTTTGNGLSNGEAITPDGRFVVFYSQASDLDPSVTDANGEGDVFVFDRQAGSVELVSQSAGSPTTTPTGGDSNGVAITPDGRYVLYQSLATNIVAGVTDANAASDVYVYDRTSDGTELISRSGASATNTSDGETLPRAISTDGRYVLILTRSTDYLTGLVDTNGGLDVLVFDRVASVTQLISRSVASAATAANGASGGPVMTSDGRYVAFTTLATDVLTGVTDTNDTVDVYVLDRQTSTLELISYAAGSPAAAADSQSFRPAISEDGRYVAFFARATDLIPGFTDLNGPLSFDAFVHDRLGTTRLASRSATSTTSGANETVGIFNTPDDEWISDSGLDVLFDTAATNLIVGFTNLNGPLLDVFVAHDDTQAPSDPTVDATSPLAGVWSNDNTVTVDWSGAADETLGSGLAGYSVVFDQLPAGVPDPSVDVAHAVDPHATTSAPLADGNSWYFHLRTCDLVGNCTATVHAGPFLIDTTPPAAPAALSSPSHGDGLPHAVPVIALSWPAVSDLSGVVYRVVFDANPSGACPGSGGGAATSASSPPLTAGTWYAHVCAVDGAGNVGPVTDGGPYVVAASVIDVPALSPSGLVLLVLALAVAAGVVSRRRRACD